jgi:hypothetical protein
MYDRSRGDCKLPTAYAEVERRKRSGRRKKRQQEVEREK